MKYKSKILEYVKIVPYVLTGFFRKRNENIWLFSSWMGTKKSDNSLYLYKDLQEIDKELQLIWIVKNPELHNEDENSYYYLSKSGIYAQLECGVVFCTHSLYSDYLGWLLLLGKVSKIQLWHGAPYKKIMWDVKSSIVTKLKRVIFDRYDFVISSNSYLKPLISGAFRVKVDKVLVSGYPRVKERSIVNHSEGQKKILYAPTFRDGNEICNLFDYYGMDFSKFNEWLVDKNYLFYIRLHPKDCLSDSNRKDIDLASNILIDDSSDVYSKLSSYDVLITDYSSIMFDFLSYGKRIIFAPFDYEVYASKLRGVYFDYQDVSIQPIANSWKDVFEQLNSEFDVGELLNLKFKFGQDLSLNSSEIIYSHVKGLK